VRRFISPRLLIISVFASLTLLVAIAVGQQKNQVRDTKSSKADAVSGAKVLVPEEAFDFGYIPNNSRVAHIYKLLSVGSDSLRILRVKPG